MRFDATIFVAASMYLYMFWQMDVFLLVSFALMLLLHGSRLRVWLNS